MANAKKRDTKVCRETLRFTQDMMDKVIAIATKNRWSKNVAIEFLIEEGLKTVKY